MYSRATILQDTTGMIGRNRFQKSLRLQNFATALKVFLKSDILFLRAIVGDSRKRHSPENQCPDLVCGLPLFAGAALMLNRRLKISLLPEPT